MVFNKKQKLLTTQKRRTKPKYIAIKTNLLRLDETCFLYL